MKWTLLTVLVLCIGVYIRYRFMDKFEAGMVEGKRVVITGASMGIGEQMAYHYAQMGAKVFITARTESKLQKVIQHCRKVGKADGEYHYLPADMADIHSYETVIKSAVSALGGIDFLVLNHIGPIPYSLWLGKPENFTAFQKTMDINFRAYVHLASHALPFLEESKGSIVVLNSVAGKMGLPYQSLYSASKFALDGFFSSLRMELTLKGSNVSITLCIVGFIGTETAVKLTRDFSEAFLEQLNPATPEDAALAIIKGGALRAREIYFPYLNTRFLVMSRDWMGEFLESLMFKLYKME